MSVVYKGQVIDSSLTKNARGGTEQMRSRLLRSVDSNFLSEVAIHFSRPKELYTDVPNILYLHDLSEDPAVDSLKQNHDRYDRFVFVSYWQRDQFINRFELPYSKCVVIQNAIETKYDYELEKPNDKIRFIYHTTPHRGLELVYSIFDSLCQFHENIHLDVFSSFSIYGWEQRDEPYKPLFQKIDAHPHMTYHGAKSNEEVLSALKSAHVFLYPSIWKETSCIAMIEAILSGCICIYPSYGALPETGSISANYGMYEFNENHYANATAAANSANLILLQERKSPGYLTAVSRATMNQASRDKYSVEHYKHKWDNLLQQVMRDNSSK